MRRRTRIRNLCSRLNCRQQYFSHLVTNTKLNTIYLTSIRVCRSVHEQLFSLWKRNSFLFNLSVSARQRNSAIEILHNETRRVIKLRRSQADDVVDPKLANNDEQTFGSKRRLAFLDSLLLAQKENGNLTDDNIKDEVDTFMFAV